MGNLNLWLCTIVAGIVEKFLFNNWDFLIWLVVAMVLDFATGVTKAWVRGEVATSKGFRNTVAKGIQYGAFLIITHVLINFSTVGKKFENLAVIGDLAYTFLILIEIKSVYENIVAMNSKFDFLKRIIGKIQAFIDKK